MNEKNRVCPVERAGMLESYFRRLIHDPRKILRPYIEPGMTAIDFGCGPGFFTIEMAQLVGKSGYVIACDLQDGMLEKVKVKIDRARLQDVISLHKTREDQTGLNIMADFVLAFYIVHEIPNQGKVIKELCSLLNPDGKLLIVEPPFHVSDDEFSATINFAKSAGLIQIGSPKIFMSKTAVLKKVREVRP